MFNVWRAEVPPGKYKVKLQTYDFELNEKDEKKFDTYINLFKINGKETKPKLN